MLKKIGVIILIVLSSSLANAQDTLAIPPFEIVDNERNYYYEDVVSVDSSLNKNKIYNTLKLYIIGHYQSEGNILQLDDSTNGTLIARVFTRLPESGNSIQVYNDKIHYTLTIKVKDGKYKYRMDNFIHTFTIKKYVTTYSNQPTYGRPGYSPVGNTVITDYEFKLNNYNPDRHKSKRLKRKSYEELNVVHINIIKEIEGLKKSLNNSTNADW